MPTHSARILTLSAVTAFAWLSCTQSTELSPSQSRVSDQQIEQKEQALNTGLPSSTNSIVSYPNKGHTQLLLAALRALKKRPGLMPELLQSEENQYYLHYGNYFADNIWINRPGTLHAQTITGVSHAVPTAATFNVYQNSEYIGMVEYSRGNAETHWGDSHNGIGLDMTLAVQGKVRWVDYPSGARYFYNDPKLPTPQEIDEKPTTHAEIGIKIDVSGLWSFVFWNGGTGSGEPKTYSLDHFYHYTFQEVQQMSGVSQTEKDNNAALRLYPLKASDLPDQTDSGVNGHIVQRIVNQPLLTGADRGIVKYGAILYQLARKFFQNSRYEPSLSELIPAGNDIPGFHVGYARGIGNLSSFSLDFPHTRLGGNPYTCADGSDPNDLCSDGLATWPIWVPEEEYDDHHNEEWLASLSRTKPGRRDLAALMYLGWATHMIQDAATPHHAANWTGYEHDRQDGYGDEESYWSEHGWARCPDGTLSPVSCGGDLMCRACGGTVLLPLSALDLRSASSIEAAAYDELNDLLGTTSNPKTRDQICSSVGITDSQMMDGELNYASVQPVFLRTATEAFLSKKTEASSTDVVAYLKNAYISTIKLLLCAPPATPSSSYPAGALEPLNHGLVAGTHQRYPWDFNVFVFGDATGLHDVAGPVAAKGAVHLNSFSLNSRSLKPVSLIAGDDLQMDNGTVYGTIHASGRWRYGSTVTRVAAPLKYDSPIDFDDMRARLVDLSQNVRNVSPTGTTTMTASGVLFKGNSSGANVFSVSGASLVNYRTFELQIPAGATAVINVVNDVLSTTPVILENASFDLKGTDSRRLLWNFQGVQHIRMASITFAGSALAPDAAVETMNGAFDGTLLAKSLASTYTEFHWYPFGGDFPQVEVTPPGPCQPFPTPQIEAIAGDGKVELAWTARTGATSYLLERRISVPRGTGTSYVEIAKVTGDTTYTDYNVTNGTTYYYVVTGKRGICSSGPSYEEPATPTSSL